jgi:uncharacterized protein YgiM (DUF1202 family)
MKYLYAIGVCLVLTLSACLPSIGGNGNTSSGDTVGTALAQTQAVADQAGTMVALTQAAASGGNVVAPPAGNEQPAQQGVSATANINLNCRSGPNTVFDLVVVLNAGEGGTVTGKNNNTGLWYELQTADGKECWADSENLTLTGDAASVPLVSSPPTPTPVPLTYWWVGTWTSYQNVSMTNDPANETVTPATFVATGPNTVRATYVAFGCSSIVADLTISSDGVYANGTTRYYGACGGSNEVHLTMLSNHNQFRGKVNRAGSGTQDWYFAGSRNGYSAPDPRR